MKKEKEIKHTTYIDDGMASTSRVPQVKKKKKRRS
jgi:hypothetical protein